jgi:hypothetical protein
MTSLRMGGQIGPGRIGHRPLDVAAWDRLDPDAAAAFR